MTETDDSQSDPGSQPGSDGESGTSPTVLCPAAGCDETMKSRGLHGHLTGKHGWESGRASRAVKRVRLAQSTPGEETVADGGRDDPIEAAMEHFARRKAQAADMEVMEKGLSGGGESQDGFGDALDELDKAAEVMNKLQGDGRSDAEIAELRSELRSLREEMRGPASGSSGDGVPYAELAAEIAMNGDGELAADIAQMDPQMKEVELKAEAQQRKYDAIESAVESASEAVEKLSGDSMSALFSAASKVLEGAQGGQQQQAPRRPAQQQARRPQRGQPVQGGQQRRQQAEDRQQRAQGPPPADGPAPADGRQQRPQRARAAPASDEPAYGVEPEAPPGSPDNPIPTDQLKNNSADDADDEPEAEAGGWSAGEPEANGDGADDGEAVDLEPVDAEGDGQPDDAARADGGGGA